MTQCQRVWWIKGVYHSDRALAGQSRVEYVLSCTLLKATRRLHNAQWNSESDHGNAG